LGHTYADVTVRPLAGSSKAWTGQALVDTGATDTFLPASVLRKLGIAPSARRSYELADGTEQELPIGFGVIEVEGLAAGGTLVFAGEKEEPLLGLALTLGVTCRMLTARGMMGRARDAFPNS
jgi:clan AA aspartic protease